MSVLIIMFKLYKWLKKELKIIFFSKRRYSRKRYSKRKKEENLEKDILKEDILEKINKKEEELIGLL